MFSVRRSPSLYHYWTLNITTRYWWGVSRVSFSYSTIPAATDRRLHITMGFPSLHSRRVGIVSRGWVCSRSHGFSSHTSSSRCWATSTIILSLVGIVWRARVSLHDQRWWIESDMRVMEEREKSKTSSHFITWHCERDVNSKIEFCESAIKRGWNYKKKSTINYFNFMMVLQAESQKSENILSNLANALYFPPTTTKIKI